MKSIVKNIFKKLMYAFKMLYTKVLQVLQINKFITFLLSSYFQEYISIYNIFLYK
jgi:hypothetical protein